MKRCRFLSHTALLPSVLRLLVSANIPSSPILVTLMIAVICSSKMSVLTRAIWHNIPEDGILHSHHCGNLKSYLTKQFAHVTIMCNG
jgi:hypothetical protein